MSQGKRCPTLQAITAMKHLLASFLIWITRVIPKLEPYSAPVALLTCQAMAAHLCPICLKQFKTWAATLKKRNQHHCLEVILTTESMSRCPEAFCVFKQKTTPGKPQPQTATLRCQLPQGCCTYWEFCPGDRTDASIQHITALPRKARKSHPMSIWLKLKHKSQAKRNQFLSQHVQES